MILALNRLFSLATENNFTDDQEFSLTCRRRSHDLLLIKYFFDALTRYRADRIGPAAAENRRDMFE